MSGPRRVRSNVARRVSRSAFAAATAASLYTAAAFGALLYAGLPASLACLGAALAGAAVATVAARVVWRHEEAERQRAVAAVQLATAREQAHRHKEVGAPPPATSGARSPDLVARREQRESREIQQALLPDEVPFLEGYHLEVDYQPCGTLGGDFYDFRLLDERNLLLTLGDVSGKGPAGAIVMAMVQTLFRENAPNADGPGELLARVNGGFAGTLGKGVFVTALCGVLDAEHHRLSLAGAGHHPVLLLNPAERRATRVGARGLALGLVAGRGFHDSLVETTIDLAPGDSLLLFTDGATDSVDDLARNVGENRLRAAAAAAVLGGPHGALQRLRTDLWQGGGRRDDTTLMLISRLGGPQPERLAAERRTTGLAT